MSPATVADLARVLRDRRVLALTGAGCSTRSGIPDYRGADAPAARRPPIQHRAFLDDAAVRRRYWARSFVGWPRFAGARPNAAHEALAELERAGRLVGVVTQNVDRLHQAAGSRRVVELHGALAEVACLECGASESRDDVQRRLGELNPTWRSRAVATGERPDGDVEVDDARTESFRTADCLTCSGPLKPCVVFFGGSVARETVEDARALLSEADAVLVVGSSLAVFSGFRFVREAAAREAPIGVVNLGPTRADPLAAARVEADCTVALPRLVRAWSS